jgi:ABC-type transport system involved in multi-copper enzyme maturation permease subunit
MASVIFLPIVARELRVAARRRGTYLGRLGAAFGALALGTFIFLDNRDIAPHDLGLTLFQALSWLAFFYCAMTGVRLTADCLSEERREGTLGFLFLTDLKGYDVVLGKLAAAALPALFNLLAILPILAIPLTLGGVTGTQLGQVALVLLTTQFLSLSLGLAVSAWFHNGHKAAGVTLLLLVMVIIGPYVAGVWSHVTGSSATLPFALLALSPIMAQMFATDPGFARLAMPGNTPYLYEFSLSVSLILALGALAFTNRVLPRIWMERPASNSWGNWRERLRRWHQGAPGPRAAFRRRLLDVNPFYWLAARDRLKPFYVWMLLAALGAVWALGNWKWGEDWRDAGMNLTLSIFAHGTLKCWIAFAVVYRLADDRRSGALDLLLSTRLTDREILAGQWRALARQFAAPVAVVLLADTLLCRAELRAAGASERDFILLVFVARGLMLALDAVALAWLGPWIAVSTRRPNHAAVQTLACVVGVPWVLLAGGYFAWLVVSSLGQTSRDPSEYEVLGVWFFTGLVVDLLLMAVARERLRRDFRRVASEPFAARAGWLRRWFGGGSTSA